MTKEELQDFLNKERHQCIEQQKELVVVCHLEFPVDPRLIDIINEFYMEHNKDTTIYIPTPEGIAIMESTDHMKKRTMEGKNEKE